MDVESLPYGEEENVPAGIETVIVAEEVRPRRGQVIEVIEVKREGGGIRKVVVGQLGDERVGDEVIVKQEPAD